MRLQKDRKHASFEFQLIHQVASHPLGRRIHHVFVITLYFLKLLVDANLAYRVATIIREAGYESSYVVDQNLWDTLYRRLQQSR